MKRKFTSTGMLFMVLAVALASLAVAYSLWYKVLTIDGTVETGRVHAHFVDACTDDDDTVNCPDSDLGIPKDVEDVGDCEHLGSPSSDPDGDGLTSCDPAASGIDPKPHWDKDVARCDAAIGEDDNFATVTKQNVYPGYFCTAWFDVTNDGTVPVKIVSATVNGQPVTPSVPTPFDLDGDDVPDVAIHLTGIEQCQQIEPGQTVQMDIDQEILQGAPMLGTLSYRVEVQLNQWNETPSCLGDTIIDADGIATSGDGIPGAVEVAAGDPLATWPAAGIEGIDMFDNDMNGAWTFGPMGDDLHLEDPNGACGATAIRDGYHDLGLDCKVLDYDSSLVDRQPVNCDLEGLMPDPSGTAPGSMCPTNLAFHDANGDGSYNNGEDIVLDANGNGVFD